MSLFRRTLQVSLFLALAGVAGAQVLELGASGGMGLLKNSVLSESDDAKLKSGFRMGFRVTLNAHEYFGHEVGYAYNRTTMDYAGTDYGMATHQGFYNLLAYARPEGSKIRPFVAGGGQFSNFVFPGLSVTSGYGTTKFGINYGAGVKVRTSDRFLIRLDVRQYMSPKPDWFLTAPKGWLRINEVSAGFAYTM